MVASSTLGCTVLFCLALITVTSTAKTLEGSSEHASGCDHESQVPFVLFQDKPFSPVVSPVIATPVTVSPSTVSPSGFTAVAPVHPPFSRRGPPRQVQARTNGDMPVPPKDESFPESSVIIDDFDDSHLNAMGFSHEVTAGSIRMSSSGSYLGINAKSVDEYFSTTLAYGCFNMTKYYWSYLHIQYSGSRKFSVSLLESNNACDPKRVPLPKTWDAIEAARYSYERGSQSFDLYVPISHFNVDLRRAYALRLDGFYEQAAPTNFSKIELVSARSMPARVRGSGTGKLATGHLAYTCTKPGLIAFGVDDGRPDLAKQFMEIVDDEKIPVTFFVQGASLADKSLPFGEIYRKASLKGHQIALHSWNHPHMEAIKEDSEIDEQFERNAGALQEVLNLTSSYFRPPFGTVGARTRQRLVQQVGKDAQIVMWSIDVEDWLWGDSGLPDMQFDAFKRQFDVGGDIVVMHYLHQSTVDQMRQMIKYAKRMGRKFVRMDECLRPVQRELQRGDDLENGVPPGPSNPVQQIVRLAKGLLR